MAAIAQVADTVSAIQMAIVDNMCRLEFDVGH